MAGIGGSIVIITLTRTVDIVPSSWDLPVNTRLGIIVSLFGFLLAGVQPFVGRLADRIDTLKPLIQFGMGTFTLSTLLLSVADTYVQVVALRALQGLSLAFTVPTSLSVIANLTTAKDRGTSMGLYGTARMLGFGIGPLIGGALLMQLTTWQTYRIAAVPGAIAFILITLGLPREATRPPASAHTEGTPVVHLPITPFLILGACFFAIASCISMLVALEQEFTDRLHLSAWEFSIAFSALILMRMFFDWPVGMLSDRVGRRPLIVVGLLLIGPATVASAYVDSGALLIAARFVMGAGMTLIAPSAFALTGDMLRGQRGGSRVGLVTAGFGLGLAVGPLLAAILSDAFAFTLPFWLYGSIPIILAFVVHQTIEEPKRGFVPSAKSGDE